MRSGTGCRPTPSGGSPRVEETDGDSTSEQSRPQWRVSEINLNGGDISIVKTIGLGGTSISGAQLLERIDMEEAELIDALEGLIVLGYVQANRIGIRTIDAVRGASFRVSQAHARELRDAVYPSRRKEDKGRRRRRS